MYDEVKTEITTTTTKCLRHFVYMSETDIHITMFFFNFMYYILQNTRLGYIAFSAKSEKERFFRKK